MTGSSSLRGGSRGCDITIGIGYIRSIMYFRVSMTVFLLVQNHEASYQNHGSNDYRSYAAN